MNRFLLCARFDADMRAAHPYSSVYVNDRNSDAAAAYTIGNLRLGFEQKKGDWRIAETLRIDNFTDRTYIGSVIVADGNGRFFEPALPRNFSLVVSARLAF